MDDDETMFSFSHVVLLPVPIVRAADAEDAVRQAVDWVKANYRKCMYQVQDKKTGEQTRVDAGDLLKKK